MATPLALLTGMSMLVMVCWSEMITGKHVLRNDLPSPACEQIYLCYNTTPIYDAAPLTCRCKHFTPSRNIKKDEPQLSNTNIDCYTMEGRIHLYRGTKNVTRTGLPCVRWAHNLHEDMRFNTGETIDKVENYCRVPDYPENHGTADKVSIPWCYVTTKKEWEYCDIEPCDSFNGTDCFTITELGQGNEDVIVYNGTTSTTMTGHTCKRWTAGDSFTSGESTAAAANYCRVVVGDKVLVPWCYITKAQFAFQREVCNIRLCSKQ